MTLRARYLVTTLALLAVGGGYAVTQGWQHTPPPRPPRVESASRPAPPRAAPAARDILERRDDLKLTDEQRARLEALDRDFRGETAGLESSLAAASQEFSRWMDDARQNGRATLGEVQQRSEDVRELAASLRARRRMHAVAAAQLLTDRQRRELDAPEKAGGVR